MLGVVIEWLTGRQVLGVVIEWLTGRLGMVSFPYREETRKKQSKCKQCLKLF